METGLQVCLTSCPRGRQLPQWLQGECILGLGAHVSHRLKTYKGVSFCQGCGSLVVKRLGPRLRAQCGAPCAAGRRNLRALCSDRVPVGMSSWPDPTNVVGQLWLQVEE